MDQQKENTARSTNAKGGSQPGQQVNLIKENQDGETRDVYSHQKDSEALPPEESHNLIRNNNLYQHKQAMTPEASTEAAPQHAQPQQQMDNVVHKKKKGTIVYQQKLTTITYTNPEKEAQQAEPRDITVEQPQTFEDSDSKETSI